MRGERRTHRALADLAKRQHGVVAGRQLARLGYSEDAVSHGVFAARLHRLHRDVFAVGHEAVSRQGQCLAAVLAGGTGTLLSHRSAAWLWGLTTRWWTPVEVTAASTRRSRSGIRMHSARALAPEDRDSCEGIPITAVPRTLLDFAALDPRFLGRAIDQAERRELLDMGAIEALLRRSLGFRGVARLRLALEVFRVPAFTRSGLERNFLMLVRDAGLPQPTMNHFVEGYELDAYWPPERFAVELDTYDYHGGRGSFESDRLRQENLKLAGIEMTRITGARLTQEPNATTNRLAQLLTQRRRDLSERG